MGANGNAAGVQASAERCAVSKGERGLILFVRSVGGSGQDQLLRSLWELPGGGRLSVEVRLDASYRKQSSAVVKVWRDEWRTVASLDYREQEFPTKVNTSQDIPAMRMIEQVLIERALWVLRLSLDRTVALRLLHEEVEATKVGDDETGGPLSYEAAAEVLAEILQDEHPLDYFGETSPLSQVTREQAVELLGALGRNWLAVEGKKPGEIGLRTVGL